MWSLAQLARQRKDLGESIETLVRETFMLLLSINLLLLVLTGWLVFRLVRAAHIRATSIRVSHLTARPLEQPAARLTLVPQAATDAVPQAAMTVAPCEPDLVVPPQILNWSRLDVATAQDVYADPIDGVPFAEGEEIHECECGVGYRAESVEWLANFLSGHCVHCGAIVEVREAVGA
jgi:hypothetical protein